MFLKSGPAQTEYSYALLYNNIETIKVVSRSKKGTGFKPAPRGDYIESVGKSGLGTTSSISLSASQSLYEWSARFNAPSGVYPAITQKSKARHVQSKLKSADDSIVVISLVVNGAWRGIEASNLTSPVSMFIVKAPKLITQFFRQRSSATS